MKSKDDKAKDLEALRKELEQSPAIFVTGYEKMTVQQDYELRKTVRGAGGSYQVIKNNIADKASEGLGSHDVFGKLRGMTSIAWTTADPVALANSPVPPVMVSVPSTRYGDVAPRSMMSAVRNNLSPL